ncbi:MAG: CHAT domain-containing protein [Candidatus Methanosuratus sp.]|nr:CHAT domain-containing protein [Candidatus Methanosuratincola sp.]
MPSEAKKPVIFLAFANEHDDQVRYLRNLPREARNIRQALDTARRNGLCDVVERSNATLKDILDVFQDPEYHNRIAVFHYGGHANGYQLLLESVEGSAAAAYAAGLASFLGQQTGLELVFLNGCATQNQVQGLLDANVSTVIATSRAIDDKVATEFVSCFYRALAGGANIQRAYNEARAAIETEYGDNARNLYLAGTKAEDLAEDRLPWDLYLRPGAELAAHWNLPEAVGNPLFDLPPVPAGDLPPSPFRHLSWFAREHAEVFFGRGYEIRDLYHRAIDRNSALIRMIFQDMNGISAKILMDGRALDGLHPGADSTLKQNGTKSGQRVQNALVSLF